MPYAAADDGVKLYYEETGAGVPVIFVHEFASDLKSWEAQRAASARTFPFRASALAALDCKPLATAWHSRAAPPGSTQQCCSQGWTVVNIWLARLG
jgi:pimeloyl-ACP methyl ester carboxylesterase